MCSQTRNSCAKAFDNRSRGKNLKPKKSRGGVNLTPPLSRLLGLSVGLVVGVKAFALVWGQVYAWGWGKGIRFGMELSVRLGVG